jgi:lipopolysaccharide export system permease protein
LFFLKYIDRQLVWGYLKSYFICLISLLSLYVVVDLFTNLDEFTHGKHGLLAIVEHIGTYYGFKLTYIFDRLSEAIALLAAMFTVAWMQASNELLPLLSAGVSTRRVVLPVLFSACLMIAVAMLNQELIIPRIGDKLLADRDDPMAQKEVLVPGAFEPNGLHLEGRYGVPKEKIIVDFHCWIPQGIARGMMHFTAKQAQYFPKAPDAPCGGGGWLMTDTQPLLSPPGQAARDAARDRPGEAIPWDRPDILEVLEGTGKYFMHVQDVDFDVITRNAKWFNFASTWQLYLELQKPDSTRLSGMAVTFHARLTRPILAFLLVILGLSVILRDQNRNVFINAGMCLVLCGVFFGAFFTCKQLGDNDYLSPTLAAWLPVLIFGPLAFVMFDAVHT